MSDLTSAEQFIRAEVARKMDASFKRYDDMHAITGTGEPRKPVPVFVHGLKGAGRIAKALKIDRPVLAITLNFDCNSASTAVVRFPLTEDDMAALEPELRRYYLAEQSSPAIDI